MKKIFLLSILVVIISFVVLTPVIALDLGTGLVQKTAEQAGYDKDTRATTLSANIGSFIKIALSFVGVIFLALMVYAGFLWLTARGESEPVEKAGKIIKTAVIGFIITVGAYSITNFIVPKVLEKTTGYPVSETPEGSPAVVYCCNYCNAPTLSGKCTGIMMKMKVGTQADCDRIGVSGTNSNNGKIYPSTSDVCLDYGTAVQ